MFYFSKTVIARFTLSQGGQECHFLYSMELGRSEIISVIKDLKCEIRWESMGLILLLILSNRLYYYWLAEDKSYF